MAPPIIVPPSVAEWAPLSSRQTENPMVAHDIVCLHTMVGYLISTDRMWRPDGYLGIESTFGVGGKWGPDSGLNLNGRALQWQDLRYQTDANLDGNPNVISVETADNAVEPIAPWTPEQIECIVRLLNWLCSKEAHRSCPPSWKCHQEGIPRRLIANTRPGQRGIGYHRQGIVGNYPDGLVAGGVKWSNARGKTCPTDARIRQIKEVIIPLLNVQEDKEVPEYVVITGPGKPTRVYVAGSLQGYPNPTELAEGIAPFAAAGFRRYDVNFKEVDDWQRFMDGFPTTYSDGRFDSVDKRLIDLQSRLAKVEEDIDRMANSVVDPEATADTE